MKGPTDPAGDGCRGTAEEGVGSISGIFLFPKKCRNGLGTVTELETKKEYSMKRFLAIALIGTVGLIYAGTASAAVDNRTGTIAAGGIGGYTNGIAANGVTSSRHNLGVFGMHTVAGAVTAGDENPDEDMNSLFTSEICVFCHTPHHTAATKGPLWNRGSDTASFTAYVAFNDGTASGVQPGPASLACLSCHDGVTQFDMLVNAPGMGGVVAAGADVGWNFTEKAGNDMEDGGRLNIGVDLTNDHPIGIEYSDGTNTSGRKAASIRLRTTTISTIDLHTGLTNRNKADNTNTTANEFVAGYDPATFDGGNVMQNLWAVNGFLDSSATISKILRGSEGTVECGSCHDPHFNNKSWGENAMMIEDGTLELEGGAGHSNGLFLRRVGGNAVSGVCRTCHNK